MLDGIEDLDWSNWDHAYGPATDVPETLRALASADQETREGAEWALYGNLWHQGTVYEATQYAVPFLLEILEESDDADRDWILVYLAHLANGSSYHDVHQHLSFYEEEREDAAFQGKVAAELSWVDAAAIAVVEGLPLYQRLLGDDDREVRACVCYLLASLPIKPQTVADVIGRQLADRDPVVRASAGFALFGVGPEGLEDVPDAIERLRCDEEELVAWVGALLDARIHGDGIDDQSMKTLRAAIEEPESLDASFGQTPFGDVDVLAETSRALRCLSAKRAGPAIDALIQKLEQTTGYSALDLVESLLVIAFGSRPLEDMPDFDELEGLQRTTLRALAHSETAWTFNVNMADMLRWWNLPARPEELQRYCGVERRELSTGFSAVGPGGTVATATITTEEE